MSKVVRKKNIKVVKKTLESPFKIYWESKNYFLFFAGIALIIIGFYFMSVGGWDSTASLIISPLILGIAYLLIFPASIFYGKKVKEPAEKSSEV
jgi:membrane protein implicated in regulation of membrane protease activity